MADNFTIRLARIDDVSEIARLSGQLGYPVSEEQMQARLIGVLALPEHAVFVALAGDVLAG